MRVCQHCKTENNDVTSRCWGCYEPLERSIPLDATTCSAGSFAPGDQVKCSSDYRNSLRIKSARAARRNRRGIVTAVNIDSVIVQWRGWQTPELYRPQDLIHDRAYNTFGRQSVIEQNTKISNG